MQPVPPGRWSRGTAGPSGRSASTDIRRAAVPQRRQPRRCRPTPRTSILPAPTLPPPPAELGAVQRNIDGSDLVGAIGYTINGLVERYPDLAPLLDEHLSEQGRGTLDAIAGQCTDEITEAYDGQTTADWTSDGRPLDQLLGDMPTARAAMADQHIGAPGRPLPDAPGHRWAVRHQLPARPVQWRGARPGDHRPGELTWRGAATGVLKQRLRRGHRDAPKMTSP